MTLGKTGGIFTLLSGAVSIPSVILLLNIMFYSLESALLVTIFALPLLPVLGYLMNRINLLQYQWVGYLAFYIVVFILLIHNGLLNRINLNKIIIKNKIIKLLLLFLIMINIIFAYNKTLSFMIVSLSFVPFIMYFLILKSVEISNKKEFYNKVIVAFSLGCIISSLPDMIIFIYTWINGNKSIRLFGPLGSNFILVYDLIMFVIIINKWVRNKEIKSYWTILVLSLGFIVSMQMSRGALVSFIAIFITYLIFDSKNWKKYMSVMLVFGTILTLNVSTRGDITNDENIKEFGETISSNKFEHPNEEFFTQGAFGEIIVKVMNSQSRSRQIIWKTAISITKDYSATGIGIGNFKYLFDEYSGTNKGYSDAHNILLNMSSELGVPFMLLGLLLLIIIGLEALITFFKEKDTDKKLKHLSLIIIVGVIFLYGNFTGIAFQTTNLIYSFSPTLIILFILFYRDCLDEF
ncbi:O-antigen ligase family protein [Clostridium sp.]|uniref:O-antigen ligase family protein n=1 Tax=Clostridium sp. TaxID=1506 RepID=UPI0032177CC0